MSARTEVWHDQRMAARTTTAHPAAARPVRRHAAPAPAGPIIAPLLTAATAAALAGLGFAGRPVFAAGLFVVQVVLILAWLAALDTAGGLGAFIIATLAAAGGDVLLATTAGTEIRRLAPVAGLLPLAALLHQLLRRDRRRVTESLTGEVSAGLLALALAPLLGLRGGRGGQEAVVAAMIGIGVGVLVARAVDRVTTRPPLTTDRGRGWPGLVIGLAAAAAAGFGYGQVTSVLRPTASLRLALVTAAVAFAADLAVHLAAVAMRSWADERQLSALPPLAVLLPLVVAGPAAFVAGRILLG